MAVAPAGQEAWGGLWPGNFGGNMDASDVREGVTVTFQFDVIKGQRIAWPRIEDDEHLMVAGSVRPLVDAFRIAHVELVEWLVADYGFDRMDAYQVLSQAGTARIANVVDPNYTVVARFPKSALPPAYRGSGAGVMTLRTCTSS